MRLNRTKVLAAISFAVATIVPIWALGAAQSRAPASQAARDDAIKIALLGSKHDFGQGKSGPRNICMPCHTPHVPGAAAPLLDQRPAASQPIRAYQSLDARLSAGSLLCLGCHDGTIAPDVYVSSHSTGFGDHRAALGERRAGPAGHPVGVRYPIARQDFNSPASVASDGAIALPEGRIQCTSCHDPHNTRGYRGFLVKSNARSRLCLTCHRL